jgi:hypothetical protein
MAGNTENSGGRRGSRWRIAIWAVIAALILLPLLAMQFTDEMAWGAADFVMAGALLFGAGLTYELMARTRANIVYRAAVGVALGAALILVWLSLGVGIIGRDGDPANLMYFGVLAVGVIGALVSRLRPLGMARALFATALAQTSVAAIGPPVERAARDSAPERVLRRAVCRVGVAVSACCASATRTRRGITSACRPTARIGESVSAERRRRPSLLPGRAPRPKHPPCRPLLGGIGYGPD